MVCSPLRRRCRGCHREDGAALVEFALILPILVLLLFGLIDFGFIYNDYLQVRQGVRDGARQGAVANFGPADPFTTPSATTCNNDTLTTGISSTLAKALICQTRNRIDLDTSKTGDANKLRIAVCLSNNAATPACSTSKADYHAAGTLVVCAMYPATSRTGFLNNFIGNGAVTTRVAIRIEQTYDFSRGRPEHDPALIPDQDDLVSTTTVSGTPSGQETALPGKDWGFCKP